MAKNASNLKVNIVDNSFQVATPLSGVIFVQGETQRGPVNDPKNIITSPLQFRKMFGDNSVANSDFSLLCTRMLARGAKLRVNSIKNSTGLANAVTGDALGATVACFKLHAKYPGTFYNGLTAEIKAASNGQANYFDLVITHTSDGAFINEKFTNLFITGNPTIGASNYLAVVAANSEFVYVEYKDLSATAVQQRPVNAVKTFTGGANGGAVVAADYIGNVLNFTGLHAFDDYDDAYVIACPDVSETDYVGISVAGEAYAASRKDLMYFQHLDNSAIAAATLITARATINSSYIAYFGGGVQVLHPDSGAVVEISELGDVLAQMAVIHNDFGEWRSFAQQTFGALANTLGVVTNFGTPAQLAALNLLAQAQINMVVRKNGKTFLNDDYTGQIENSARNFIPVMLGTMFVNKSLSPLLNGYLKFPNVPATWLDIYYAVKPFLDSMVTKEAWFDYSWDGDQFATSLDQLQVNTKVDVLAGKYKVSLKVVNAVSLTEFSLDIVLSTATGVSIS